MEKRKNITLTLRAVLILLFIVSAGISFYFVFYAKGDIYIPVVLSVFTAFITGNSTIILFNMQPVSPFKKGPEIDFNNDFYPILVYLLIGFLLFFSLIYFLPQILLERNSYRPALLFIISGSGCAAAFAIITLINIKSPRHNKKITGPVRMWQLSLFLFLLIGVFAWFMADWNPVLKHADYKVHIIRSSGFPKSFSDQFCDLDVGWLRKEKNQYLCRARLFYKNSRIYGWLGDGAFNCKIINKKDGSWEITGGDYSIDDGDPFFIINTYKKQMVFKRYTQGKKTISLEGKILDKQ